VANILTAAEAAAALRCAVDDPAMLALLPQVDAYIRQATGHDWAADTPVISEAKSAARMLLVMWYENPAMTASGVTALNHGLTAALVQLESLALRYKNFEGGSGAGYVYLPGVREGDTVQSLIGIIGLSGDQSARFEAVISMDDYIKQLSSEDLTETWFRAYIVSPGEL